MPGAAGSLGASGEQVGTEAGPTEQPRRHRQNLFAVCRVTGCGRGERRPALRVVAAGRGVQGGVAGEPDGGTGALFGAGQQKPGRSLEESEQAAVASEAGGDVAGVGGVDDDLAMVEPAREGKGEREVE